MDVGQAPGLPTGLQEGGPASEVTIVSRVQRKEAATGESGVVLSQLLLPALRLAAGGEAGVQVGGQAPRAHSDPLAETIPRGAGGSG